MALLIRFGFGACAVSEMEAKSETARMDGNNLFIAVTFLLD
jgi:hypothetical protein